MEFYDSFGMTRDVASRPETNMYGIRSLLSCKYLFDYMGDDADISKSFTEKDGKTKMPYWKFLKAENGFRIYENTCYIPMGFTYDSFITNEEFDLITNSHKTEAILYSMVLSREQMQNMPLLQDIPIKIINICTVKHPKNLQVRLTIILTIKTPIQRFVKATPIILVRNLNTLITALLPSLIIRTATKIYFSSAFLTVTVLRHM